MDLEEHVQDLDLVVANMLVARPFEQWNVVDLFNTTDEERTASVDLVADLHLDPAERYLVFDYWRREFLGLRTGTLYVDLPAHGSAVLAIRRLSGAPQILSTSRHITQGAVDLRSVLWDGKEAALSGVSELVADDPYVISLYVPEGFEPSGVEASCPADMASAEGRLWSVALSPAASGPCEWRVRFDETT
jgi:hypothetical protein